jgi:hypothetical protein
VSSYFTETYDGVRNVLPKSLSRIWARALWKFEFGLSGVDPELVKCVTLTTDSKAVMAWGKDEGNMRNSWKHMVQDNRNLRKRMTKDGLPYRDCFCGEITPQRSLIHLHGFMIFSKPYSYGDIHERLSKHWGDIHKSEVVWVKDMWDVKGAIAYDCKHAIKNYISERYLFGDRPPRLLMSRDWLPNGWRDAEREINRGASEVVDFRPDADHPVTEEYYSHRFVQDKWKIAKQQKLDWKAGKPVIVDRDGFKVLLLGANCYRLDSDNESELLSTESGIAKISDYEDSLDAIDDSDYSENEDESDDVSEITENKTDSSSGDEDDIEIINESESDNLA